MRRDPLYCAVRNSIPIVLHRAAQRFDPMRVQQADEARRDRERDRIATVLAGDALAPVIA